MKAKFLLPMLVLFTVLSCSDKNKFRQFDKFPEDHRWQLPDKKTFEFEIADNTKIYNLAFLFSHIYDYQFNTIPINFEIHSPDGTIENINESVMIKDTQGKELGDCSGDICDLKFIFKKDIKLQPGNYKITISHNFRGPYLPNVLGVGVLVDLVK
ncbi:hypothetical protein [Flavobacterium sp.]